MPPQNEAQDEARAAAAMQMASKRLVRRGTNSSELSFGNRASLVNLLFPSTPVRAASNAPEPLSFGLSPGKSIFFNRVADPAGIYESPEVFVQSLLKPTLTEVVAAEQKLANAITASAHVAYNLSDILFLYPAAAPEFGDEALGWQEKGIPNAFGYPGKVTKMHSRAGAAGTVHGALLTGEHASVLCSGQSLPLMIPSMYRIARSRIPTVFHVAAESVEDDLSVINSHDDVMAVRHAGFAMLCSSTPQESHDLSVIAHIASLQQSSPFLHFFDGKTASQELSALKLLSTETLKNIAQSEGVQRHRNRLETGNSSSSTGTSFRDAALVHDLISLMKSLTNVLDKEYQPFEYHGAADAEAVVVVMGTAGAVLHEVLDHLRLGKRKFGILNVRLFRPWSAEHFLRALPSTVRRIAVLDRCGEYAGEADPLYMDVQSSISSADWFGKAPQVVGGRYGITSAGFTAEMAAAVFSYLEGEVLAHPFAVGFEDPLGIHSSIPLPKKLKLNALSKHIVLWDEISGTSKKSVLEHQDLLMHLHEHDDLSVQGAYSLDSRKALVAGRSNLSFYMKGKQPTFVSDAVYGDLVACASESLLELFDVAANLKHGGIFLLNSSEEDEQEDRFSSSLKFQLATMQARVVILDAQKVADEFGLSVSRVMQLAAIFLLDLVEESVLSGLISTANPESVLEHIEGALVPVLYSSQWLLREDEEAEVSESARSEENGEQIEISEQQEPEQQQEEEDLSFKSTISFLIGAPAHAEAKTARRALPHEAALPKLFPDAYRAKDGFRHSATAILTVTKWQRLTPLDYDRNVFHIEFDTTGTGLTYKIGEALAVYGHNDEREVERFLDFYGLAADDVVAMPRGNKQKKEEPQPGESETIRHEVVSVGQLFTQVLDIFGRPSKKFYEGLAEHATDEKEKEKLHHIVSPEGKEELQRRIEETITYADLLREFRSARPSLEELIRLISPIKPRHYSIASSMKMNPNSVHLLIVVHDWKTPSGAYKIGQCTRYLSSLREGAKVSVAVCSSVMKLPKDHKDPIIMAGLGTGMAPFRAFIQERAYWKAQGEEVGPISLYFGSRYKSKEFLYGDEMEAYHREGLLTNLRTAFSRDQKEKIYIQHRMNEDKEQLGEYMTQRNGHFYLCGPTWPASDVKDAMVSALVAGGMVEKEAGGHIEDLKNIGRYVLEVY